jgi:CO/xanthine dehydrogenase Mo-binding subunit
VLAGALVVPLHRALSTAPAQLSANGYLAVLADGKVSLALPKTEMGQGIMTALTMLVAEELGLRPPRSTCRFPRQTAPALRRWTRPRAARPRSASCGSRCARRLPMRAWRWSMRRRGAGKSCPMASPWPMAR